MAQIASRQNSVNYHNREQIDTFISQKQIRRRKGRLAPPPIRVCHVGPHDKVPPVKYEEKRGKYNKQEPVPPTKVHSVKLNTVYKVTHCV